MKRTVQLIICIAAVLALNGCSTQKNTAMSRFYHSMLSRYNIYYNGNKAYQKGLEEQETAVQYNYLDFIDVYPVSNKDVRSTGKEEFDRAIEKSQKCITLHSIKAKPEMKPGHTKTEKDKKVLARKEYNPFLWHAWLLMADAQRQKGEFLEAASTYSYIARMYSDQPEIAALANIRTAQCYSELDWKYEADELFSRISRDSIPARIQSELAGIRAEHLLKQRRYDEALPMLGKSFSEPGMSRLQKIHRLYLKGQLEKANGNPKAAYDDFQKVIRMNPPYRIEFNARIQQTETMTSDNSSKIEKKLNRMRRDPNNREYLDQVYYAIGNVYLSKKDTLKALEKYETGLIEGTNQRPERGILLLQMATIYWDRADYANAQRCYSEAVGYIDESHPQYRDVMTRSSSLENLVKYSEEIKLQDSLQYLATLSEEELNATIDKIIEDLVKREKEAAEEAARQALKAEKSAEEAAMMTVESNDGSWYFYNPVLLREGAAKFTATWGRRKLEDNWRRMDKSVSIDSSVDQEDVDTDSGELTEAQDSTGRTKETDLSTDPHNREFYIRQIPFTPEQKDESNSTLAEALFQVGVIYKDELSEYGLAENVLTRSANGYPDKEYADDALFNLFLLYSIQNRNEDADRVKSDLLSRYPDSRYAQALSDDSFNENIAEIRHREDSLYQIAYECYLNGDTLHLAQCCRQSAERFPSGKLRAKFLFLEASNCLKDNRLNDYLEILKQIVEQYPTDEIANLAESISNGIRSGRILQSTSLGSIWDLSNISARKDSTDNETRPEFNAERMQPYIVVMAYPADSIDEDQLLFETARYNFSRYMVRNFNIQFRREGAVGMQTVSEFLNFDEAYLYRKRLFEENGLARKLDGIITLIITPDNLETLLKYYSFNEYIEFFDSHFLDIPEFEIDGLTLDEEILTPDERQTNEQ